MRQDERLTQYSQALRKQATQEENTLWYQFLRKYPVQFRRQCVLGSYIVDFYCAKASLVLELDGSRHYETEGIVKDAERTCYLESLGLKVLRFSNRDIRQNLPGVCQAIDLTVRERYSPCASAVGMGRRGTVVAMQNRGASSPHPPPAGAPSPQGEGFKNGGPMSNFELSVPCLFGLEGIAGDELRRLNIENVRVENGRVLFSGDESAMARANVCLRTGERVLLTIADFKATTFEQLFQGVYNSNLEDFIPKDGCFPVKGHCLNSQLMSVPDCQAIIKKAASRRLGEKYGVSWLPETGAKYQLQFSIMNDRVQLYLDTSGPGLHKRGYRANANEAPLRETLAAAMVQLTRYRGRDFIWDPFCGSGTIPIEAALIARNKAPGMYRRFAGEAFAWVDPKVWGDVRAEAKDKEFNGKYQILGSDNDPKCISLSIANARKAGVADCISFRDGDATKMDLPAQSGVIICNPPYGQRMMEQQSAQRLYAALGRHLKYANDWKKYIITSEPEFEHYFGQRATKKRKLYNGMIKCDYYMYTENQRKKK
ncbi:MAG: DUF559 domain-containing protein [Oscillospiraceae bacterium]|nr:DUF559 domain-containing protein [Oscillospiraceae bacterium]